MFTLVSSSPIVVIPIIIIIFGALIFSSYYFGTKQVVLRTLSKIPHKSVNSFKTNEVVKFTGKALHVEEPLIAPLSKRKCIFYYMKIEQKKSSGKSSHWKTIVSEQKIQNFFLEHNGNMVIVKPKMYPRNYKSYLVIDKKTNSGTFNDPNPEFESLLRRYNIDSTNFFGFNKQLRYKEGVIEIGEQITVAGIVNWKSLSEPIPEYPYSKIATIEEVEKQKIIITDLPETKVKNN